MPLLCNNNGTLELLWLYVLKQTLRKMHLMAPLPLNWIPVSINLTDISRCKGWWRLLCEAHGDCLGWLRRKSEGSQPQQLRCCPQHRHTRGVLHQELAKTSYQDQESKSLVKTSSKIDLLSNIIWLATDKALLKTLFLLCAE